MDRSFSRRFGYAAICGCTAFGAVCGSSIATAATMCTVALPEMRRYGYIGSVLTGKLISSGVFSVLMIPPSTALLFNGILYQRDLMADYS